MGGDNVLQNGTGTGTLYKWNCEALVKRNEWQRNHMLWAYIRAVHECKKRNKIKEGKEWMGRREQSTGKQANKTSNKKKTELTKCEILGKRENNNNDPKLSINNWQIHKYAIYSTFISLCCISCCQLLLLLQFLLGMWLLLLLLLLLVGTKTTQRQPNGNTCP